MKPALGLTRIFRPRHSRLRICRNMISSLANLRNFLDVKVQGSGGFTKAVRGFANANDAGGRFDQDQQNPGTVEDLVARLGSLHEGLVSGFPCPAGHRT